MLHDNVIWYKFQQNDYIVYPQPYKKFNNIVIKIKYCIYFNNTRDCSNPKYSHKVKFQSQLTITIIIVNFIINFIIMFIIYFIQFYLF